MECPVCGEKMVDGDETAIPDMEGKLMGVVILECPKGCDLSDLKHWFEKVRI